jgi:hypothetical protein
MSMISLLLLMWLAILAGWCNPAEMLDGERVASSRFSTCQVEATDSKAC